jgi:hypothetical protein
MTTTTDDELHAYRRAPDLRRLMLRAAMVGIGAILLALIIAVIRGKFHDFFHGYLVAFLMFLGLTLGCIALGLLVSIVGGRWGEVVRPVIAAGAKALPLMAILFLPLLLGLKDTYPWASNKFDHDEVIVHQRHIWLSTGAFVIRAVVYFVIWAVLAGAVVVWSRQRDTLSLRSEELPTDSPLRVITGPGIAVFGITVTFAAIDWVMSVEPRWYSTIFGLSYIAGVALGALAFASLAIVLFTDAGGRVFKRGSEFGRVDVRMSAGGDPARGPLVKPTDFGDLGNLLMTFTMLWAYLNFSQFLIIWAGNMPAEVRYYTARVMTGWKWVGLLLIIGHFAIPFFTMFSRDAKRNPVVLGRVAAFVLVMRAVDWIWVIEPSVRSNMGYSTRLGPWILSDLLLLVGIGGIWLALFCWQMSGRLVLPLPIIDESHHGDAAAEAAAHGRILGPGHGPEGGPAVAGGGHHG